jgi:hypothetical protein
VAAAANAVIDDRYRPALLLPGYSLGYISVESFLKHLNSS